MANTIKRLEVMCSGKLEIEGETGKNLSSCQKL